MTDGRLSTRLDVFQPKRVTPCHPANHSQRPPLPRLTSFLDRICKAQRVERGMAEGLYESLHTRRLDEELRAIPELEPLFGRLEKEDAPEALARHIADAITDVLRNEDDDSRRAQLVNELLGLIGAQSEQVLDVSQRLIAVTRRIAPGVFSLERPITPLSQAALLTNAKDEPSFGSELPAELASANRVDLLCAFVRWHGIRVLEDALLDLKARGVPLRVITTTYVGATERRAVDEVVRRFGAEVRISYETQTTRLHAKAWLIRRATGFDTAYVGSSNLSRSALVDGLEWNVRLSGVGTPALLRKFEATFDTYWNDAAFKRYDPETDADLLDDALRFAGNRGRSPGGPITLAGLEVRALPHQDEILEALESERERGHHRNLVVAATGTGKTVVAALDYRRLRQERGGDPTLLFVAHRKEILEQSL